jgi:RNA 3'-terminal phosphate cyclase-like protein
VVESARGVLNHLIPDVFIYTDHYKGRDAGASPGFGCSLAAESTEGVVLRYSAGAGIYPIAGVGDQAQNHC